MSLFQSVLKCLLSDRMLSIVVVPNALYEITKTELRAVLAKTEDQISVVPWRYNRRSHTNIKGFVKSTKNKLLQAVLQKQVLFFSVFAVPAISCRCWACSIWCWAHAPQFSASHPLLDTGSLYATGCKGLIRFLQRSASPIPMGHDVHIGSFEKEICMVLLD